MIISRPTALLHTVFEYLVNARKDLPPAITATTEMPFDRSLAIPHKTDASS